MIKQSGRDRKGYLYIEDTAEGLLAVAEGVATHKELAGEAFNIVPNDAPAVIDLVKTVLNTAGVKLEPTILNPEAHFEVEHLDNAKAKKLLGWSPEHSLVQGLEKTLAWYRKHQAAGK